MATLPTLIDLFGSTDEAIATYRQYFQTPTDDMAIVEVMTIAFTKIEPVFGEFRNYEVDEDTIRNEYVKRAVCFEANSIANANAGGSDITEGHINTNTGDTSIIKSESMEDVSVTYETGKSGIGMGDSSLMRVLGLLSADAAIILSRFIRKSYGWGIPVPISCNPDKFNGVC